MVIKVVFSLVILIATSSIGYIYASRYNHRVQQLRHILHGIQLLETEVLYSSNPLPEAMKRAGERSHPSVSGIFLDTAQCLYSRKGLSLSEAWNNAVEKHAAHGPLQDIDQEVLMDFGKQLGTSDKDNQKKNFHMVTLELQKQQLFAEEERSKNEKMCRSLGILAGLAIVIVFI
ncbi:stage III sporulation protein AB [Geosporobacter subterraneus DSM 17957]|uniref:Stage III sporulation protein AB n=1 Tax=Geosporobacter subterraneus DSM 17957 TaxID=1121919 RepID=A0A1M6C2E9_9FIRM|nr:stage III sporulation protein AB [Geosporobacter subterraneus DSM 17957]